MSVWSLCVCLWAGWVLGGGSCAAGVGVNSEVSIDDPKTVKECRVHIEKALEEYWDKTEPSTEATRSNRQLDSNPLQEPNYENKEETPCDQNTNSESNPEKVNEITETDNEEDDEDDDDDTESPGDDNNPDAEQETDQYTSDSSANESQNNPGPNVESHTQEEDNNSPIKSSDAKTASGEAQETKRVYVVKNLNKEPIEFDDLNSDKVDEDKGKEIESSVGEVDKETEDDDDDDEDDDDDDDETDDSQENEADAEDQDKDENAVVNKIEEDKVLSEEQKDEGKKEDKEINREEASTVVEVSVPEVSKEKESSGSDITSDQAKLQINSSKVSEEKEFPASEIKPSVVIPSSAEPSQLVTETPEIPQKPHLETPEVVTKSETGPELSLKEELIENIYEDDDDDDDDDGLTYRNRNHIDAILGLDEVGTELEKEEEKLAQSIFKDIKKIEQSHIKPMELLYKFSDSTTRSLGDAEIFNRPMILFLGPWNSGKTSIINYILGIERTPSALETGTGITDVDFKVITHGPQRRVIGGTELVTDWRYSGVQKFGQGFLDHFRSIHIPHALLQKVTIVDTPGILENRKTTERGYSLNDAFQWFIDRADAIYVVLDPNKVDIGGELSAVIDQLKGREVRFVLNKADSIRRSDLMRVVGQLFWNLSPLMSSSEAPVIYAVSLTTHPYHPSAPTRFLDDQEKNLLYDMRSTLDKRVENRILYARKHAVRVRNHAKMVDCYLATFYRHKSIFSNKRNVAKQIVENPGDYSIYDGIGSMTNVSRYDLPSPAIYKDFFRTNVLYDFKPLASTCSYFRGCPMDKLDEAIAKDIPELMARYKKAKIAKQEVAAEEKR